MPWVIEKIEHNCYAAKFGERLESTERYDPYYFSCIIEDVGNGIALISNATGDFRVSGRNELENKLVELGFTQVRWVRVVTRTLKNET